MPEDAILLSPELAPYQERLDALVERFWADAEAVDQADRIPPSHLAALAEAGWYGALAPVARGGLGLSLGAVSTVVEMLASASLAPTFVWIQHFGLLSALLDPATPENLRAGLPRVVSGELKGGIALAGLLPGPPRLVAEPTAEGWKLYGEAPWVTGWGMIDLLLVTARGPNDTTVTLLMDAREQGGLGVSRFHLSAMHASSTIRLTFDGVTVPEDRLVATAAYSPRRPEGHGLRNNGSLALGVARRCCLLLGPSPLDQALHRSREALDGATPEDLPAARARASALAVQAAHALAVQRGSRSVLEGDVAERLTREAAALLVFGSRPGIKQALFEHFSEDR
jgi:alkylation response protein AidB-like acyl-CoA dehydrogenase